jgi:hypothetical protein
VECLAAKGLNLTRGKVKTHMAIASLTRVMLGNAWQGRKREGLGRKKRIVRSEFQLDMS